MSDRDNSGAIFKNDRREKDTHPTHTGQCTIDGKQFWISAWVKEGSKGRFFSLAFKPKTTSEHRGASANPPARTSMAQRAVPDDEDVPF
jgi:hypothetical protein